MRSLVLNERARLEAAPYPAALHIIMPDHDPTDFTFNSAQDECDQLNTLVEDMFAHQVAGRIASFAMLVGAMTETEEELKRLQYEATHTLVRLFRLH